MNTTIRALLIALLAVSAAACQDDADVQPAATEAAPLTAPATDDDLAWQAYVTDVVTRNMGPITNSPYVYYLPASIAAEAQEVAAEVEEDGADGADAVEATEDMAATIAETSSEYARLLEKAKEDIARGILPENMLAFASPNSEQIANLTIGAFADVQPGSMKGVRVLFIGTAADGARVGEALAPTGVDYVFVDTAG